MKETAIERTMREIRERVETARPEEASTRLRNLERALSEAQRLSQVYSHWGITPSWPVGGRIEVLLKRAMRIGARWYINPIVEQQNDFNVAVLAALYELEADVAAIRSTLDLPGTDSDGAAGDERH